MVATLPDFEKQNELVPSSHKTSETINLLEKNSLNSISSYSVNFKITDAITSKSPQFNFK